MARFLDRLSYWNSIDIINQISSFTESDVDRVLKKENLTIDDFLILLSPASDKKLEDMAKLANYLTIREFGRTIQIYTPLYLSNFCKNRCVYCGFNSDIDIKRSKLTLDEIHIECEKIKSLGIRHIILLTGGDRVNSPPSYIKEAVRIASKYFDSISIEVYALTRDEYYELGLLGVQNVTIYQETYNEKKYNEVHLSGEKSFFGFRLDAPERAASSGIKSINLGSLLGLDNPILDFFFAGIHTKYIFDKYPSTDVSISIPRIRDNNGSYIPRFEVDDALFVKFILAYRIFMPKAGITLSTREKEHFRNSLIPLGITKMSAGSKTNVGGYTLNDTEEQFEISDDRTVDEIDNYLRVNGYQPIYKDWVLV